MQADTVERIELLTLLRKDPLLRFPEQVLLPSVTSPDVLAEVPQGVLENRNHELLFGLELVFALENLLVVRQKRRIEPVLISPTHRFSVSRTYAEKKVVEIWGIWQQIFQARRPNRRWE